MNDPDLTPTPAAVEALARFLRRTDANPATPSEAQPPAKAGRSWSMLMYIRRSAEDARDA